MHSLLRPFAHQATRLGWHLSTADTHHRTELLITPSLPGEQHGSLGIGLGVALGASTVSCWIWEGWSGTCIEPDLPPHAALSPDQELHLCPQVADLQQAVEVFNRAAGHYLAQMRALDPQGAAGTWAPLPPLTA